MDDPSQSPAVTALPEESRELNERARRGETIILRACRASSQLSLPNGASEVTVGSEVHKMSEVSPDGEVANLNSLCL